MEMSPYWETASRSACQVFSKVSWKRNVHCRVYKSPPLVPILNQIIPVHSTPSYFSTIHFNISLSPIFRSFYWYLSFWISYQSTLCVLILPHSCYMPCPSHPPLLDHSNYIWRGIQVMNLLIMQFLPASCHLILLRSKYTQHPFLKDV
jgi:hypothetical protein